MFDVECSTFYHIRTYLGIRILKNPFPTDSHIYTKKAEAIASAFYSVLSVSPC